MIEYDYWSDYWIKTEEIEQVKPARAPIGSIPFRVLSLPARLPWSHRTHLVGVNHISKYPRKYQFLYGCVVANVVYYEAYYSCLSHNSSFSEWWQEYQKK